MTTLIDLLGPTSAAGGVPARPAETRTFLTSDTFYNDCTSEEANDGTEVRAAALNQVIALLRMLIRGNGAAIDAAPVLGANDPTADNANDDLLLDSVRHLIQRGMTSYAVDTGTTNALVVSLSPALREYKAGGKPIWIKKSSAGGVLANSSATPTVNINGLGAKTIVDVDGTSLDIGQLTPGLEFAVRYDGTNMRIASPPRAATQAETEAGVLAGAFVSPATLFTRRTPFFFATGSAGQSIADDGFDHAVTNITALGDNYFNTGSGFSSSSFTCGAKDAGAWMFFGYVAYELLTAADPKTLRLSVAVNGATGPFVSHYFEQAGTWAMSISQPFVLEAGDVVTLVTFNHTGASRNIFSTQLVGYRIGGAV